MAKTECQHCSQAIEYPEDMAGETIACPICGEQTALPSEEPAIRIPESARRAKRRPAFSDTTQSEEKEEGAGAVPQTAPGKILQNVEKVVVGKRDRIELALVALFAEGHILLEDVPGVAKTMLGRAIARSVGAGFKRVQCTPDLLPNDITGSFVFNPKTTEFDFRAGPLFAQIVLADEINRTTPRTQSALLEAMSERQVTVDGERYELERPFLVIATQNPIDHEGTFPLPEAQLDRFLVRLSLGYPTLSQEGEMLDRVHERHPIDDLEAVVSTEDVLAYQATVRQLHVDPKVRDYMIEIVHATREHYDVQLGGSPRASMAVYRASQALAAIRGQDFVLPDDVKEVVPAVLGHRLILRPESRMRKVTSAQILDQVMKETPVPTLSDAMA